MIKTGPELDFICFLPNKICTLDNAAADKNKHSVIKQRVGLLWWRDTVDFPFLPILCTMQINLGPYTYFYWPSRLCQAVVKERVTCCGLVAKKWHSSKLHFSSVLLLYYVRLSHILLNTVCLLCYCVTGERPMHFNPRQTGQYSICLLRRNRGLSWSWCWYILRWWFICPHPSKYWLDRE